MDADLYRLAHEVGPLALFALVLFDKLWARSFRRVWQRLERHERALKKAGMLPAEGEDGAG